MGTNNLLSVTYMVWKGYTVNFGTNMCEISKAGSVIRKAENRKGLWVLDGNPVVPDPYVAHVAKASLSVWHKRLGHAMTHFVKKLLESSMVTGMELIDDSTNHADGECIACIKGKTTWNVIPKKSDVENPRRLHRIYSNVCGSFDIEGYSWSRYFVTFINGFSHYVRVKPIRSKDEASKVLKEWITRSKIETGEKANLLRTDGGGEYMGTEFQEWLRSRGMHHKVTNANTPQENRVAERLNRTILEMMRTMMHESDLPKNLWPFVIQYTQEIVNRLPTRVLSENKTSYEAFHLKKPSVKHLRIFGCRAYVHVPDDKRGKLDAKTVEGRFIGLPQNRKGYIVSDSRNLLRVYVSRDVMFVETPETSEHMTIQIDEEVPESDGSSMDIERRNSEVENSVAEDNNVGKNGTTETTVEDAPIQLHRSTRVKHTPT